jgi:excisionase family DNA binding protein
MKKRRDVFTTGEIAKMCRVSPHTVIKWINAGLLEVYCIPGSQHRRVDRESLVRFLEANGMSHRIREYEVAVAKASRRKDVFTTGEVARICRVAPRTVAKWIDSGCLKGYRIPGSQDRRIPVENLIRFLKEHGMPLRELEKEQWHKVLLIGTEALFNHRIRELLPESENYRFEIANSGFEAGTRAGSFHPDVIVIDLALGRRESIEIVSNLREDDAYATTLIIGLANEDEAEPDQLLQYGFNVVFKKPIDIAVVAKRIEIEKEARA